MRWIGRPATSAQPGPERAAIAAFAWREARIGARTVTSRGSLIRLLVDAVAVGDALIICVASWIAYGLRHDTPELPSVIIAVTLLAAALTYKSMRMTGAYLAPGNERLAAWIGRSVRAWSMVFGVLTGLAYLTKTSGDFSRIWAIGWYGSALAALVLLRVLCHLQIRRWRRLGWLARTVAIVDLTGSGERLARRLRARGAQDVRLVGLFSAGPDAPWNSGIDDLIEVSRLFRIDEVLVTVSGESGPLADIAIRRLGIVPTNLRLCPDVPDLASAPLEGGMVLDVPALTMRRRPINGWHGLSKRIEDVVIGSVALLALSPLMLVIALAIKLDSPGPVFFRQRRLGFNNNVFLVWKFRSMTHRPEATSETEVPQARRGDPRVTAVGGFLRRTSLDEVPQLINVLSGEMSLVGPRPHALPHNDQYVRVIDDYLGRHRVLPGLTGLAQVNGCRGETETLDKMQRRVDFDLAYIDGWSMLLDLRILARTAFVFAFQREAY